MSGPGAAVTVVIPVWDDYVQFLSDAVESVRRNDPDVPIVVVDNASATPVPELEACRLIHSSERLSSGAARNLGLGQVATEYVVFLDADDMLLDGTLAHLYGRIRDDEGLAMAATSILDGGTGERHRNPRRFVSKLAKWPRLFAIVDSTWSVLPTQGCAIMPVGAVRMSGGYADADLGEDWVLAVSLAWRGRVEVSQRLGRYYRPTEGSIGRRPHTTRELRASARRVRERMRRDSAVPRWARALLPGITVLQLAVIQVARPAYLAARRLTP